MRMFAALAVTVLLLSVPVFGQGPGALAVRLDDGLAKETIPAGLVCHLVREDPNVTFTRVQAASPGADHTGLLRAWGAATREAAIATGALEGDSTARFDGVAAGHYWVVTLEPVVSGRLSLFWAEPVQVESTAETGVMFSLSNAILVLDSLDCHIH